MKKLLSLITLLVLIPSAHAAFYQYQVFTTNTFPTSKLNNTNMPDPMTIGTINSTTLSVSGASTFAVPIRGDQVDMHPGSNMTATTNGSGGVTWASSGGGGGSGINTTNGFGTNTTLYGTGPAGLTVLPGAGGANSNWLGGVTVVTNLVADLGTNYASYATGTAYTMTASQATLSYATVTPNVVIAYPGTYSLRAVVNLTFSGATYVSAQTIQVGLVKTNGGSTTFIANRQRTMTMPVLTTFTGGQTIVLEELIYNASAGDGIVIQGLLSSTPSAGSVIASDAEIIAVRLH